MLVNQSKQGSNQAQKSYSLPWAWQSSAPACFDYWFIETSYLNEGQCSTDKDCLKFIIIWYDKYFSTGPNNICQWQRATFILFFLILQGTSIGLARTNHALLSLVATKLMQYTCTCASHQRSCTDLHHAFFSIELILFEKKFIKGNRNIYGSQKIVVLTYNQGLSI